MRYTHFCRAERLELSILRKKGYSLRDIAGALGKSPSSVSRELRRNYSKIDNTYVARKAHHKSYVRRKYAKYQGMKIQEHRALETYIKWRLPFGWSPEDIAGRWNRYHAKEMNVRITAKGIYKWLYSQYGQHYCQYLYSKRYRPKRRRYKQEKREIIKNRITISERPAIINERKRYGDFEVDTMGRARHTSPETLAVVRDRTSRYLQARKAIQLRYAMDRFKEMLEKLSAKSATFDNGVENTRHEELGIPTYFCNPYSSWEKGSVENGIKQIRRYIPKGSDLAHYSHQDIEAIVHRINNKPMKCLNYQTPQEVFEGRFSKTIYPQSVALDG